MRPESIDLPRTLGLLLAYFRELCLEFPVFFLLLLQGHGELVGVDLEGFGLVLEGLRFFHKAVHFALNNEQSTD